MKVRACTAAQTWPGTTALENSLFSCTSLLGVVSNLSAMLFSVSLDSTWSTKESKEAEVRVLLSGVETDGRDGTQRSAGLSRPKGIGFVICGEEPRVPGRK